MIRYLWLRSCKSTDKIDKTRSRRSGILIRRIAQLSDELIVQSDIVGKIIGEITYVAEDGSSGFAKCDNVYIVNEEIIDNAKKKFRLGQKVKFSVIQISEKTKMGYAIELLN